MQDLGDTKARPVQGQPEKIDGFGFRGIFPLILGENLGIS